MLSARSLPKPSVVHAFLQAVWGTKDTSFAADLPQSLHKLCVLAAVPASTYNMTSQRCTTIRAKPSVWFEYSKSAFHVYSTEAQQLSGRALQ